MSYHLARHGVLAIYSGNQPSVMRLMPTLVVEEEEVDFLLEALDVGHRRPAGRRRARGVGAVPAAAPAGAARIARTVPAGTQG